MTAVTWDDEALCEMRCATLYLGKRGGKELAERFVSRVEAAVTSARSEPTLNRTQLHGTRRVRLTGFSYHVVYWHDELGDSVHIIAIAHASRDPGYWRDRLL